MTSKKAIKIIYNNYTNVRKIPIHVLIFVILSSCSTHQNYIVTSIKGTSILVDSTANPSTEMLSLVNKYKSSLDKEMNVTVGHSDIEMKTGRPESLLTNFTADAMLEFNDGSFEGDIIDIAIVNVNGLRAPIAKGEILKRDLFRTYSFDNMLVIQKIKGSDLLTLFQFFAKMGGAGISNTAQLTLKDKELVDAKVKGIPIDSNKQYTIITLDYLAEGNDGMEALKNAQITKQIGVTLRDYMIDFINKEKHITSQLDNRIVVQ